jgi:metal-sulfur cluster biosynthetic enzyme
MPLAEQQIWTKLKECYDPELPRNIVDLGRVYAVKMASLAGGDASVDVTTQNCPMASRIAAQVQRKLLKLAGISEADVKLVFDPPWDRSRITPEGRKASGWNRNAVPCSAPELSF